MIVIKIGGSLLNSTKLKKFLKIIVEQQKKCIVIPGGGIFSDTVRKEQKKIKFDDLTAHNLGVLSMLKVGYILKNKIPTCCDIIKSVDEVSISDRKIGIWNPENEITEKINQFTNWSSTSDTIALKVSKKIDAKILIVLKSCKLPFATSDIQSFQLNNKKVKKCSGLYILDEAFPSVFANITFPVYIFSIDHEKNFKELLNNFQRTYD